MTRNVLLATLISGSQASGVLIALLVTRSHHELSVLMIALGTVAAAAAGLLVALAILVKNASPHRATDTRPKDTSQPR